MKTWRYIEPDFDLDKKDGSLRSEEPIVVTMSEHDILLEFYPHWCVEMRKVGLGHLISEQACIEDWVVVNWAEEVKDEEEGKA